MHSCFNSFVQVDQNNLSTAKTFVGLYYLMDMWHLFSLWAMLIQLFATKILLIIVSSELSNLTYTIDKNTVKLKKRVNVTHFMVHMISFLKVHISISLVTLLHGHYLCRIDPFAYNTKSLGCLGINIYRSICFYY